MVYETKIYILYKMRENIVVIIRIYGAIAIFLLICDHQDTESESCEIEMSISHPILPQGK